MKQNTSWLISVLRWVLFATILSLIHPVSAQIVNPEILEEWQPVPTEVPPTLDYQPPPDADEMQDFAPSDAEVSIIAVESDSQADTPVAPDINSLVIMGNEEVGVFVEEQTFSEDVTLEFTELDVPVPVAPITTSLSADTEMPLPPLTATNTISNPVGNLDLARFQLDMVSTATEQIIPTFEKPIRIVVDLRSLTQDLNPVYSDFYLAYQDEEDPDVWIEVPINVYQEGGLISADVLHFSSWAAGVRPQRWNPKWSPPGVSEFSGAATYNYPIEVPPGRNGLQPNVTLSYNSRAIDGRIRDAQSGPIGDGWSLAEVRIVRVGVKLRFDAGNLPETYHPDKFRLVFNGTGHELYPASSSSGTNVRYYVKDAPGMFVERRYDASHTATDGLYWIVITPDGTRYRLGWTDDAEEYQTAPYHYYIAVDGHGGHSGYTSAIGWNVDTVTDPFGNQMTYHYHTNTTNESIGYWDGTYWQTLVITTRVSRINTIKYNYPTRVTTLPAAPDVPQLSSTPGTRIEFRPSNTINGDFQFLINSIFIYHGSSTLPITEYRIETQGMLVNSPGCINQDVQPNLPRQSHTRIVNSIRRFVNTDGDATTSDTGYALPATTFSHTPFRHFGSATNSCFTFYYLTGYQNGYGGTVNFTYTSDNRSVGSYQYITYNQYNWPTIGYNYTVTNVSTSDGRNPSTTTAYAYTQPCYSQWGAVPAGAITCGVAGVDEYGNIVGHLTTTQTNYDYNGTTVLNKQVTTFSQFANSSIGRPTQIDVFAGSSTLMNRTTNTYATESINGLANMFTYTSQTTTRNYSNGSGTPEISSKTVYEYRTDGYQGTVQGVQYGNLTHIYEYDDVAAATPYRTIRRWYDPNTTNWVVNKPRAEGLYEGSSWTFISGIWNYYDGSTTIGNLPSQGFLTRTRQVREIACTAMPGGGGSGCTNAYETIDTTFGKDAYGNTTTITTYNEPTNKGFGYRSVNANNGWVQVINTFPTGGRTTTITYETGYNLYPVQVSNPLGHLTKFELYGFKNVAGTLIAVDGFQKQPGLLKAVINANNVATKYEYDPFGRLHAVYDAYSASGFGDTLPWNGNPVSLYKYWDNTWNNGTVYLNPSGNAPFEITVQTRPESFPAPANSSSGFAFNEQTFFDGFGRPIQTRSVWNWVSGQSLSREIITSTAYNAQGQVSCQTVPYDVPFYTDRGGVWPASPFVTTPCTSLARTTTTYDGLGRPLITTAPDGSITENLYAVTNTISVGGFSKLSRVQIRDANGHLTNQFTNSRGQLVLVRNNTGNAWGSYVTYLDTQYYYNLQGNLTTVQQRDPNDSGTGTLHMTTNMTYDNFGRKIGMVDPDMGVWSYTYNAAGSLISQKDARGNQLCFGYDNLDRLLNRTLDSTPADACPATPPTSGSNHLATYTYDPTNGKGQIGTVSWGPTPTQNKDTFTYDTLGRLTKQTRLIDNRSYVMETTSFDPLHRPLTIKYPTNEIVTLTYDHEGEQTLQAGADTLVGNVTYNARGQLVLFDRGGSAPDSTFLYHPQTDAAGGGTGDSNFRLKTIQHGAAGTGNAFPDFTYEYDKVSNISKLITLSTAGTDTQTFTYDDLDRLLTASATGGVANYSQTYAYSKLGNITSFAGTAYTYSGGKPHAVTHLGGVQKFWYDANGNMTTRIEGSTTYSQVFDVENRLTSVTPSGGSATTFSYDATGQRTKTVQPGGSTTYFPFPGYEETVNGANTIKRSSYGLAGQTVAIRVSGDPVSGNNGLFYVLSDHLGSTSMLVNTSGSVVTGSTTRNLPYGGYRGTAPSQTITDRDFTGQKENMELGLLYYQARFYVPGIGRFASADTIVPDPASPQSFNRYAYTLNNPVRYTDPTGHVCYDPGSDAAMPGNCNGGSTPSTPAPPDQPFTSPFFNFTGDLTLDEMQMAHQAASDIAQRMAQEMGGLSAQEAFLSVFGGPISLSNVDEFLVDAAGFSVYAIASHSELLITVGLKELTNHYLLIHEIFHLLDIVVLGGAANQALWDAQRAPGSTFPNRPNLDGPSDERWGFAGSNFSEWQKSRSGASGEEFADMGMGWTYNRWESSRTGVGWSPDGQARANFMNVNMAIWLNE